MQSSTNRPGRLRRSSEFGRLAVRILCFAVATYLALPQIHFVASDYAGDEQFSPNPPAWTKIKITYDPAWARGPQVLPGLSPYVALGSLLSRRSIVLILPPVLLVTALVMMRRHFLCRWVCPVGFLNDQAGRFRRRARIKRIPDIGRWIVLLTLGGAAAGYPLVLWLDPFSIFTGAVGVLRKPLTIAAVIPAAFLFTIVLLSGIWPGLWCSRVCPLGAMQEILFGPRSWLVRRKMRNAECGMRNEGIQNSESRIQNEENVLSAVSLSPRPSSPVPRIPRRALVAIAAGAAAGFATRRHLAAAPVESRPILPPGAVDHLLFSALCIRCGNCVRACPSRIIKPDIGQHGLAALLTPTLSFDMEYCHPDCVACTQVCPSGALGRVAVEAKSRVPIGIAVVRPETCERVQGGDCAVCMMTCMFNAIRSARPRDGEYGAAPVVIPKQCIGCGACELVCPAYPKAIIIQAPK